eukprot:jgi/Picre1/33782/NNA_001261.t1
MHQHACARRPTFALRHGCGGRQAHALQPIGVHCRQTNHHISKIDVWGRIETPSVHGRRVVSVQSAEGLKSYLDPIESSVSAFGPATVANLGPGFDWLGCAIDGEGDIVTARVLEEAAPGEVVIESIEGDGGRLSLDAAQNCAGIAAIETVKLFAAVPSCGIGITLKKGLPLGSGMGSSAASAAAAAVAVNALFGNPLSKEVLVGPGLISESTVSGFHADNIAPAVLGGFVLVRSCDPLDLQALTYGSDDLFFVLVNPKFEAPTAEMRAVLPKEVPMASVVNNSSMGATLVAGILEGRAPWWEERWTAIGSLSQSEAH